LKNLFEEIKGDELKKSQYELKQIRKKFEMLQNDFDLMNINNAQLKNIIYSMKNSTNSSKKEFENLVTSLEILLDIKSIPKKMIDIEEKTEPVIIIKEIEKAEKKKESLNINSPFAIEILGTPKVLDESPKVNAVIEKNPPENIIKEINKEVNTEIAKNPPENIIKEINKDVCNEELKKKFAEQQEDMKRIMQENTQCFDKIDSLNKKIQELDQKIEKCKVEKEELIEMNKKNENNLNKECKERMRLMDVIKTYENTETLKKMNSKKATALEIKNLNNNLFIEGKKNLFNEK